MYAFARPTDGLRDECITASQPIDERRLPDTRRTKQAVRSAWRQGVAKRLQTVPRRVAERKNGVFDPAASNTLHQGIQILGSDKIRLA